MDYLKAQNRPSEYINIIYGLKSALRLSVILTMNAGIHKGLADQFLWSRP